VALELTLADPDLYRRDPGHFERETAGLEAAKRALATAEDRWLELEAQREELESVT